ncbi:hypothetical protein CYMTET_8466, partial [Cymbomonas tetramitiformis]
MASEVSKLVETQLKEMDTTERSSLATTSNSSFAGVKSWAFKLLLLTAVAASVVYYFTSSQWAGTTEASAANLETVASDGLTDFTDKHVYQDVSASSSPEMAPQASDPELGLIRGETPSEVLTPLPGLNPSSPESLRDPAPDPTPLATPKDSTPPLSGEVSEEDSVKAAPPSPAEDAPQDPAVAKRMEERNVNKFIDEVKSHRVNVSGDPQTVAEGIINNYIGQLDETMKISGHRREGVLKVGATEAPTVSATEVPDGASAPRLEHWWERKDDLAASPRDSMDTKPPTPGTLPPSMPQTSPPTGSPTPPFTVRNVKPDATWLHKRAETPYLTRTHCPGNCTAYGTCNEELSRCDCPVNRTGADCSEVAMPECELIPGYENPCSSDVPLPCTCLKACYNAWGGESAVPGNKRTCYDYNPLKAPRTVTDLDEMYHSPQVKSLVSGTPETQKWNMAPILNTSNEALKALPLSQCPQHCSLHGWCHQNRRCTCFAGWEGVACDKWNSRPCLSDCSGKGVCHNGFCQCQEGFWGTDCSISWGPDNKTPVLWGRNDTTKASRRPFIYIYELPPQFDTWYNGYRSADRQVGTFMHERLLNSEYRTPNPATADLFFVPFAVRKVAHFQNAQWKFKGAWNYIQATWPYLERNQGRDHLQVLTGDYGPADHFGYGVGKTGLPPPMTNVILLEHNGNMKRGMFRKGHDVNLPPIQGAGTGFDHHFSPLFGGGSAGGAPGSGNRSTLLFFAGGIQKKMGGALNVRTAVWKLHQHTPGFSILDTKVRDYKQRMAESVFCLAPPGTGGDGWGRRMTLGALY